MVRESISITICLSSKAFAKSIAAQAPKLHLPESQKSLELLPLRPQRTSPPPSAGQSLNPNGHHHKDEHPR
jgi:hypothetical protein